MHEPVGRLEHLPQLIVRDLAEAAQRRDVRIPERLGPPDVADAAHEALVE